MLKHILFDITNSNFCVNTNHFDYLWIHNLMISKEYEYKDGHKILKGSLQYILLSKNMNNTKFEIIGSKGLNLHLSIRIRLWINILTQLYSNRDYFNRPVESKANIQSISSESKKIDNYTLNSLAVKENSILFK